MKKELEDKIDEILNAIDDDMSDLEKELAIHDYIVLNTAYDEENYNKDTYSP